MEYGHNPKCLWINHWLKFHLYILIHIHAASWDSFQSQARIPSGGTGVNPNCWVDHPTLCCLLWIRDNGPLPERETSNLNLTQEALKATQNKLLSSGIPPAPHPHWKTISTVIKGEPNRLISSKVTVQSLLNLPRLPFLRLSLRPTCPLFSRPLQSGGHQWNATGSLGGLEVIRQKCFVYCARWQSLLSIEGWLAAFARIGV